MLLTDTLFINEFGNITFQFGENGSFTTYKQSIELNAEFIIVLISLDSDLTTHILYNQCSPGFDFWSYYGSIFYFKNIFEGVHPGFKIEIYDKFFKNKILEKNYHFTKKFRCLDLKSNRLYLNYSSHYTFFYDSFFLKNYTIKDDDVVYDLGANIGSFSLACSNYNVKQIYTFEPNSESFGYLKYNCEKYGKNITCFKKAISSDFKKIILGGTNSSSIGHRILEDKDLQLNPYNEVVDGINLEKFVYVNNLQLPTYIKVDIEGSEYEFFENTTDNFFKNTHTIFLEFHYNNGENVKNLIDRFVNLNYKLVCTESALDFEKSHMNTLFLTK